LIETITTSIFYSKFKENNENDMAALGRMAAERLLTLASLSEGKGGNSRFWQTS
jgi:hypothetical protein